MSTVSSGSLRRVVRGVAELPLIRSLAKPVYRQLFSRDVLPGNSYCGVFASVDEARANAPESLPTSFDFVQSGDLYNDRLDSVVGTDYPILFWLSQLFAAGCRTVFDLGGNVGTSYYGFRHHLDYPEGVRWLIHDVPMVVEAGRRRAERQDPERKLQFTGRREDVDGSDILLCGGVLQYLDYTLAELLRDVPDPPRHILVNMTPLHPEHSFVTLQRVTHHGAGIANCPYRIASVAEFIAGTASAGYAVVDQWQSFERYVRIPFEPAHAVDCYYGFHLRRSD
ncbi:MAG: methyltransferase, TIGR04325 family [Xanthomonadaceae bacterium]|nr:methyltransferase, TIGR04325 family [Xanthomonadaceae bacterium]